MDKKKKAKKTTQHNKLTYTQVKKVLPDSLGSINWLANQLQVSWSTMKNFIEDDIRLTILYEETVEKCMSKAKDNVYNAIMEGDMQTTKWYLSKMAPEYKDKLELDGDFDVVISIKGGDDEEIAKL